MPHLSDLTSAPRLLSPICKAKRLQMVAASPDLNGVSFLLLAPMRETANGMIPPHLTLRSSEALEASACISVVLGKLRQNKRTLAPKRTKRTCLRVGPGGPAPLSDSLLPSGGCSSFGASGRPPTGSSETTPEMPNVARGSRARTWRGTLFGARGQTRKSQASSFGTCLTFLPRNECVCVCVVHEQGFYVFQTKHAGVVTMLRGCVLFPCERSPLQHASCRNTSH